MISRAAPARVEGSGSSAGLTLPIAQPDRDELFQIFDPPVATVDRICRFNFRLGECFADAALANPLFARYVAQGPAAERFIRSCLMTHRARGLAHTAREVLAKRPTIYSLAPRLRDLSVPTLLIVGEDDEPCLKVHRFMADTIPGARHVVIPGVGHLTNLEAPYAFNRAVTTFLGGTVRRPTRATKRRPRSGGPEGGCPA